MANPLMMRYAASRGERNGEHGTEMRDRTMNDYGRNGTYDTMRMPYRAENNDGVESRYRGKDGRWHSGRRNMGEEWHTDDNWPMGNDMRMDEDEEKGRKYKIEVLPNNVVQWPGHSEPYGEREMPSNDYRTSRQIGFGARNHMEEDRRPSDHMMGMSESNGMEFDRETAEHWVRSMKNEDKSHPTGGKWSAEMLKPIAQKYGIPTEGKKFWELYAMTNAMYSDYGEVARKFGITSPEFYVCMAKAWMDDKDAEPDKTALYYEYIVKKE